MLPADAKSGVTVVVTIVASGAKLPLTFITEGKTQRCVDNLRNIIKTGDEYFVEKLLSG